MSKNSVKTILITLYLSAVQDPEPLSNLGHCASLSDCRTSLFNLGSDEVLIILISTLGVLGFTTCLIMVRKNDEESNINLRYKYHLCLLACLDS